MKGLLQERSILIVDDESELREILAEEFAALGASVRTASGGDEAYTMYELSVPDVILSDVRMSGGNGVELLNRIRQKTPDAPPYFILVTGFAETQDVQVLTSSSMEMITKPFSLRSLRDRVVAICNSTT